MKDFKDFQIFISDTCSEKLANDTKEIVISNLKEYTDEDGNINSNNFTMAICGALVQINIKTIFSILEQYHEWLND